MLRFFWLLVLLGRKGIFYRFILKGEGFFFVEVSRDF